MTRRTFGYCLARWSLAVFMIVVHGIVCIVAEREEKEQEDEADEGLELRQDY